MAKGVVGSIALKVLPDTTLFQSSLQKAMERVENRYRSRPVPIAVEPKLDQKKVNEIRRRLEEAFVGLDADVRANLNKASVKKAKKELRKLVDEVKAEVKPVLDKAKMAAVSAALAKAFDRVDTRVFVGLDPASLAASKLGMVSLTGGPHEATVLPVIKNFEPIRKQLDGQTWYKYVDAAFKPGTLDGLKGAFYSKFPELKPWVWPQLDMDYVRTAGRNTITALQNEWNSKAGLQMRATVSAAWGEKDDAMRKRLAGSFKGLRAFIVAELDKTSVGHSYMELAKLGLHDVKVPFKAVLDSSTVTTLRAKVAAAASAAGVGARAGVRIALMEPPEGLGIHVKAAAAKVGKLARIPFKAVWDKNAALVMKAKAKAEAIGLKKTLSVRAKAVVDVAKTSWDFFNKIGAQKFIRWKLQVKTTEGILAIKKFGAFTEGTLKGALSFSGLSMAIVPLMGLIGSMGKAIKAMGPALGAAAGVMGAFAVGAGIALIALKDAKTQLADLSGPLQDVKQGIDDAFWGVAKAPILENAKKLIDELGPGISQVADSMGGVFAKLATGLGNSSSQMKTVLDNTASGFDNMGPGLQRFVEGFMRLFEAGSSFFPQFGSWIDALSQKFTAWLDGIEANDGLVAWMQGGIDAAKTFGSILGDLFGIIGSVFGAASAGGAGMEAYAEKLSKIRDVIASPEVQEGLTGFFSGVNEGFSQMSGMVAGVFGHLTTIGPALGEMVSIAGGAFATLGTAVFDALAKPEVIGAITSLVQGFGDIVTALSPAIASFTQGMAPVIEKIGGLFSELAPTIGEITGLFGELVVIAFDNIADLAMDVLPPLLDALAEVMPVINDLAAQLLPLLVQAFALVVPPLMEIAKQLLPFLAEVIMQLIPPLMEMIDTILPPVMELIQTLIPPLMQMVEMLLPPILSIIQALIPVLMVIIDFLGAVLPPIIAAINTAIALIMPVIQGVIDIVLALLTTGSATFNAIVDAVSGFVSGVTDFFSGLANTISSIWNGLWNGVKSFAEDTWNGVKNFFKNSASAIGDIFSTIGDAIKKPFEIAFNAVKSLWNSTIGKLSFKVPDWVPGIGGKGFEMPKLAEGGIITRPTIAMVGEAGDNEAVIPLPKLQPMIDEAVKSALDTGHDGGKGDTYNVTVHPRVEDMKDLLMLLKFIQSLPTYARMKVGVFDD